VVGGVFASMLLAVALGVGADMFTRFGGWAHWIGFLSLALVASVWRSTRMTERRILARRRLGLAQAFVVCERCHAPYDQVIGEGGMRLGVRRSCDCPLP